MFGRVLSRVLTRHRATGLSSIAALGSNLVPTNVGETILATAVVLAGMFTFSYAPRPTPRVDCTRLKEAQRTGPRVHCTRWYMIAPLRSLYKTLLVSVIMLHRYIVGQIYSIILSIDTANNKFISIISARRTQSNPLWY